MLNRRILRIKAFKTLYGAVCGGGTDLNGALEALTESCEATRDLYLFMLAIISPLTREARNRIDAGKAKFNPSEEELHPNEKFADNQLAVMFDGDPDFTKLIGKKKLSWDQYDIQVRHIFDSVQSKDYFQKYMENEERTLAQDCSLFIHIFEDEFVDNQEMEDLLEEMSVLWIDDLAYALTYCCRTLKDIAKGQAWHLPELYQSDLMKKKKPEVHFDSDREFVRRLLAAAYSGYQKYFDMVAGQVPDWDSDRLFSTDMALICLGLAEVETFPEIDVKVSLNEYTEISKYYSSPKSRSFVNGLLHKVVFDNFNKQ